MVKLFKVNLNGANLHRIAEVVYENDMLELRAVDGFNFIVSLNGADKSIDELFDDLVAMFEQPVEPKEFFEKFMNSSQPIKISGETGSGKSLLTQSLSYWINKNEELIIKTPHTALMESHNKDYSDGLVTVMVKDLLFVCTESDIFEDSNGLLAIQRDVDDLAVGYNITYTDFLEKAQLGFVDLRNVEC